MNTRLALAAEANTNAHHASHALRETSTSMTVRERHLERVQQRQLRRLPPHLRPLAETTLLSRCSKYDLDTLRTLGTIIDLSAGRLLARRGQYPCPLAVIISGEVLVTTTRGDRRFLRAGQCLGAIERSPQSNIAPGAFETVEPTSLLVLDKREVVSLRHNCPDLIARLFEACDNGGLTAPSLGANAKTPWTRAGSFPRVRAEAPA